MFWKKKDTRNLIVDLVLINRKTAEIKVIKWDGLYTREEYDHLSKLEGEFFKETHKVLHRWKEV